jgi:hypothetical protein
MAQAAEQDAITQLEADHRKVAGLFADYQRAGGVDEKKKLARQICTELKIHTIIEEEIFYPACEGKVDEAKLAEAYVEHDAAKVLIGEIEDGGDPALTDAKVKVLSEEITHHVAEEEKPDGVFAQATKAGLDMAALGSRLAARKRDLLGEAKAGEALPTRMSTMPNQPAP